MSSPCQKPARKQGLNSPDAPELKDAFLTLGLPATLHWLVSIDHPRNAIAIDTHAKAGRPESLLKRHLLFATFAKSLEDALSFGCIFHVNRNIHASRLRIPSRRAVRAHDVAVANFQRSVHDQVLRIRRQVLGHRAFAPGHLELNLATQNFRIMLKSFVTLSIEIQVCIDVHDLLLSMISVTLCKLSFSVVSCLPATSPLRH